MDERELVREVRHARSLHAAPARLTAETMPRARGSFGRGRNFQCNFQCVTTQAGEKGATVKSLELQMKSVILSGMAPV